MTGHSGQVQYAECCQHCGNPLTPGGTAFGCTDKGGVRIPLSAYCADPDCRRARDEAAIERAIERGVITR